MVASAFLLSGVARYQDRALELLASLHSSHFAGEVWWRTEHQRAQATASDLAWLIDASMDAYELTGLDEWRTRAVEVATYLAAHHWDGPVPSDLNRPRRGRLLHSERPRGRSQHSPQGDLRRGHALSPRGRHASARASRTQRRLHRVPRYRPAPRGVGGIADRLAPRGGRRPRRSGRIRDRGSRGGDSGRTERTL